MRENSGWRDSPSSVMKLFHCHFIGPCFSIVARLPFEANSYIKVVPNQVLAPVIESVKVLGKEEVDEILCSCFSVFITSLMDFILEESFKFRYVWFPSRKHARNHDSLAIIILRSFFSYFYCNCRSICYFLIMKFCSTNRLFKYNSYLLQVVSLKLFTRTSVWSFAFF